MLEQMINRMIRAAKLDPALYEEVEHDKTANGQAVWVVALASLAAGIGGLSGGPLGLLFGIITALGGWVIWAGITLFVGTKLIPGRNTEADYGQMLRTLGFAATPGILRLLGVIPFLTGLVFIVAFIWTLAAGVVAIKAALDHENVWHSVAVVAIGWVIQFVLFLIFASIVTGFA